MNEKQRLLRVMLFNGIRGFAVIGAILFASAGSLQYRNGWLMIASLAALMLTMGLLLWRKHPDTLKRRMQTKEKETVQKVYVLLFGILFLSSFVLAGLDYRFQWAQIPFWGAIPALIIMCVGYALYGAVILQNAYAARTVEVQEEQTVISAGLYARVRHPMYLACLLVFLPMPLVLGSFIALLPMLVFPLVLAGRIQNEERVLRASLPGYAEYTDKTRYRLIPYVW